MGQRTQWQVASEASGGNEVSMRAHVWRLVLTVACFLVVDSVAVGALESTAATAIDTPITFDIVAMHAEQGETIDPLTLEEVPFTTDATLEFNTVSGHITYTPEPAFVGGDSFEYIVCDIAGSCDMHIIAVDVFEPVTQTPSNDDASASTTIPLVEGIELPEALPEHLQPTTTTAAPIVSPTTTTTIATAPAPTPTTTTTAPAGKTAPTTTSTTISISSNDFSSASTTEAPAASTTTAAPQTSTTTVAPEPASEAISLVADAGLVASSTSTITTDVPATTSAPSSPTTTTSVDIDREALAYADAVAELESKPITSALTLRTPNESGSTTNLAVAGAVVLGFIGLGAVLVLKP
jgi:hypothetical protein